MVIEKTDLNLLVTTEHHITVLLRLTAAVYLLPAVVLDPSVSSPLLALYFASSSILSRFHGTPCTSPGLSVFPILPRVESLNMSMHHPTSRFYE